MDKLSSLYRTLENDPFDENSLIELFSLEKQRENKALSFYLADRIKELNQKKKGDSL